MCIAAAVGAMWTRQLLRKVRLELAQIPSTMGDHWTRQTAIPCTVDLRWLEWSTIVLLLIALVLFLYNVDRAAAIVSALAILYLAPHLKRTNYAYLRRSRL